MRKGAPPLRVPGYRSTGMLTSPKLNVPDHSGRDALCVRLGLGTLLLLVRMRGGACTRDAGFERVRERGHRRFRCARLVQRDRLACGLPRHELTHFLAVLTAKHARVELSRQRRHELFGECEFLPTRLA